MSDCWISPRIWRSERSRFNDDEPLNATEIYTEETLREIRSNGFDAIWMRGRLGELIRSEIFGELNDPLARRRIDNLRRVIADGEKAGIKIFLYFNEPLALPADHEFFKSHPELKGEPHCEGEDRRDMAALCTSAPEVKEFLRESVANLFADLSGLGGVILITASEYHTHCWSHRSLRLVGDTFIDSWLKPIACPRCKDRQPAEVVHDLLKIWADAASDVGQPPQIWAWNWSWSMWYEDPQKEVIELIPDGVKLLTGFERGGKRNQSIGEVDIDEYSLGYVGPGERFKASHSMAKDAGIGVCVKLQIGTTHELATVPNLPLIGNLFDKLKRIDELGIEGLMCSWNFGNSLTLNTCAFGLFAEAAQWRNDRGCFLGELAQRYFGDVDIDAVKKVWDMFSQAFGEYPFSVPTLYFSPMNYAPAYPLSLEYLDRPMGPSWIEHEPWGDRLEDCFGPFTLEEIIGTLDLMAGKWEQGLTIYQNALAEKGTDSTQTRRRIEELSCARMVGVHLKSAANIFRFHQWRRGVMDKSNLQPPCTVRMDERAAGIFSSELENARTGLELVESDARLGYHQECHAYMYDADKLREKIKMLQRQLG